MIEVGNPNDNNVLRVTASEKVTKDDYDRVLPKIEQMLDKHGELKFYVLLDDVSGIELGAIWEDLKFDYEHRDQYGKTAVVGDRKWEEWGTKISKPFFPSEMKFFEKADKEDAWRWVNA